MPSVIITGADRGFGLSLCREYLARGWTVFACKFHENYDLLEKECSLHGKDSALHIVRLDVTDVKSIAKARDLIAEKTDSIDMLISNAALMGQIRKQGEHDDIKGPPSAPFVCSIDEPPMDLKAPWSCFNVNALGPAHMVEHFLPLMDKGSMKRLCFVSSEVACILLMKHRAGNSYPYPMSKSSLNMGVRLMHNLLYPQGYSFRLYHPGWMKKQLEDGSLSEFAVHDPAETAAHAAKFFEAPLKDEHRMIMYDYLDQEWPF